jgi:hypothetical protein
MAEAPSRDEELRRIREFLENLQGVLANVVHQPLYIIPGRHIEAVTLAWIQTEPSFNELMRSINPEAGSKLEQLGLMGAKLHFELSLFDHARARLLDHAPQIFVRKSYERPSPPYPFYEPHPAYPLPVETKKRSWWQRLKRLLSDCLKTGDILLGTLAVGFPPAGVIQEFKEGVEWIVDLGNPKRH